MTDNKPWGIVFFNNNCFYDVVFMLMYHHTLLQNFMFFLTEEVIQIEDKFNLKFDLRHKLIKGGCHLRCMYM